MKTWPRTFLYDEIVAHGEKAARDHASNPATKIGMTCSRNAEGSYKENYVVRKEPDTPMGTIALLAVYLVIILLLWGNVYVTMLSRGVTQ